MTEDEMRNQRDVFELMDLLRLLLVISVVVNLAQFGISEMSLETTAWQSTIQFLCAL